METQDLSLLKAFATSHAERVTAFMREKLDELPEDAPGLCESMKYALLLGGKRARPVLVYAAGALYGVSESALDYAAAAVECIHSYSLIHDDMPEMDNDPLRRGHPTVHVKFGQAGALLSGDSLQALAFQFLSDPRSGLSDAAVARLTRVLSKAAGYNGMCGGQALDLDAEHQRLTLSQLRHLHALKTGALIRAAVQLGAQASDSAAAAELEVLDRYGADAGLAFQIWDDVLDVTGETAVLGKTAGIDALNGKNTYPALLGLDKAKAMAAEAAENAASALDALNFADEKTAVLRQFASFCVQRDH